MDFQPQKSKKIDKFWTLVDDIRISEPDYATTKYSQPDPFAPGFEFDRAERIFAYWKKRDDERRAKIVLANKKRRYDEYWAAHQSEKLALESEKTAILAQIEQIRRDAAEETSTITAEFSAIPGQSEIDSIDERVKILNTEKATLGLFKGKEKKVIKIR